MIRKIFAEQMKKTFVLSCVQNIMGKIYVDNSCDPKSVLAVLGDFYFPAGIPNQLLLSKFDKKEYRIIVPENKYWEILIENSYKERAVKIVRYALKNEKGFDIEKLENIKNSLSEEFSLKEIDKNIFNLCLKENWSRDLVSQFETYEKYKNIGLGFVILKDNEIVSGASSYSRYEKGIEIEIDTREDYRRNGLAYICGAALILESIKRGLYPSWDAHNRESLALAEKLGYELDYEYTAYEVYSSI